MLSVCNNPPPQEAYSSYYGAFRAAVAPTVTLADESSYTKGRLEVGNVMKEVTLHGRRK